MKKDKKSYRKIPQVGKLLESSFYKGLLKKFSREEILLGIKNSIEDLKKEDLIKFTEKEINEKIKEYTLNFLKYPFRKVVNATGILIHTNLGRAPLLDMDKKILESYSNLELNLKDGKRGERNFLSEKLLKFLTNSEGALVLNNNASSVFLLLSTFAKGGEVIISRGELVEIGGSFRLPDILRESGCKMVEVGTTNKTKIKDYENAINEKTKAILKVHPSNFRILGYSEIPSIEELCNLAHKKKIPFFVDQGNGLLFEVDGFDLKDEEPIQNLIKKDVDVVTFSGDKLLGGPQAGILVGKKFYIEKMQKSPLYRVLRPGKETFFYLQETLKFWIKKDLKSIPLWKLAHQGEKILKKRAEKIKESTNLPLKIIKANAQFGGGTTPLYNFPSIEIRLENENSGKIYKFLLNCDPPIITIIRDNSIVFNLKSVFEEEDELIIKVLKEIEKKF